MSPHRWLPSLQDAAISGFARQVQYQRYRRQISALLPCASDLTRRNKRTKGCGVAAGKIPAGKRRSSSDRLGSTEITLKNRL